MSLYPLCLAIGAIGLVTMAVTGLGRHGHGHVGAKLGGRARAAHGQPVARSGRPHHGGGARATATAWLWSLTSPRLMFSVLVGFGTTGLLLRSALAEPLVFAAAVGGGVLFERGIVGPVWNFLLRFASAPALTLESCILDERSEEHTSELQSHSDLVCRLLLEKKKKKKKQKNTTATYNQSK